MIQTRQMIGAEYLKLRKRVGLFWWSVVLLIGSVIVIEAIVEIVHLADSANHGPAGGIDNLGGVLSGVGAFAVLVAVLIGTTAGSGDVSAGVFRDLVSTGHSRVGLFFVRLPGALLLFVPLLVVSFLIALAVSYLLAGDQQTASAGLALHFGVWLLISGVFDLCVALGFGALLGSRGIAIGVLLAAELAIGPILASINTLGSLRDVIPAAAVDALRPTAGGGSHLTGMGVGVAVVVLIAWVAVFLAVGAWRTATQDA